MIPGSVKLLNGRLKAGMFGLHLTTGTISFPLQHPALTIKRTLGIECIWETKVFSFTCQVSPAFALLSRSVRADPLCLKRLSVTEMPTFSQKQQPCYFLVIRLSSAMTCNQKGGSTRSSHLPSWSEEALPGNLCVRTSWVPCEGC